MMMMPTKAAIDATARTSTRTPATDENPSEEDPIPILLLLPAIGLWMDAH
jgi:hypothetical protein